MRIFVLGKRRRLEVDEDAAMVAAVELCLVAAGVWGMAKGGSRLVDARSKNKR